MEGNRHLGLLIVILFRNLQDSVAIDPPAIVNLENEGNTDSLNVTWTPPDGVAAHVVTWSPPDGSGNGTSPDLHGTATEYIITDLTPGTLYSVTVTAKNGINNTNDDSGLRRTKPSPVSLTESGATNDSISAQWTRPSGAIDQYNFSCSDGIEDPSSPIAEDGSNVYQASCVGLSTAGANYTITVTSQSGNEISDESYITITALPSQVTDLTESGATNDSVSATWTKPNGVVSSYNVTCPDGSTQTVSENNDGSTRTVTCSGLPAPGPGGNYNIMVVTLSDKKASDPATVTITDLPNPVQQTDSVSTVNSVSATWMKPAGEVTSYEVLCSGGNVVPPSDQTGDGPFSASCVGLPTPGDEYTMNVTSVSNGQRSDVATIALRALPLSANLSAGNSTINSVSAMWPYPGGSVDVFEANCSNGTESNVTVLVDQTSPNPSYLVSCDGVWNPGDNYIMVVTSVSNEQDNSASIVLTALPRSVDLVANTSTTSSVSATWQFPGGIVEEFEVQCSDGNKTTYTVQDMEYLATCMGLDTPGDNYTMTVTSLSNTQRNSASIVLTALPEAVELSEGESNTTAISATWTVPNSVVDTFNITCSGGTASPASIPVISSRAGQQLTAYCVGLPKSGEQYDLSVVAISKDKLSAVSAVEVFSLPLGVDLEEGPSTLTSVNAFWMRQEDSVESYSITCSHGDAFPSTIEDTDQESFSAACVNLPGPGATYSMTVYSEVGTDSSSNSTRASSLIYLVAVPEAIENISVTQYATTTVDVQWNLKQCSGCVYNYFLLTFEPDSQEPIRVDYIDDVNPYSSQVSGLTEGRSYSFTVVSVSGVGVEDATLKTSEEMSVDQKTVPATPSELSILLGQRELNLVWAYAGDADDFTITVTPDHGIAAFNGDLIQPAAEVIGLTPGTMYDIDIITVSGDERSEPVTQTARTLPDRVQIGLIVGVVALLLYAVAITFLYIQLRRKVPTRTEENGPDPYMDLEPRPEASTTYEEMAITSTASSQKTGERYVPSSHLIYENQNVGQFANKIKGDADYETVLTPN